MLRQPQDYMLNITCYCEPLPPRACGHHGKMTPRNYCKQARAARTQASQGRETHNIGDGQARKDLNLLRYHWFSWLAEA